MAALVLYYVLAVLLCALLVVLLHLRDSQARVRCSRLAERPERLNLKDVGADWRLVCIRPHNNKSNMV